MKALLYFFSCLLISSCTINLYRPIDPTRINLEDEKSKFLESHSEVDTILVGMTGDCQQNGSEDYLTIIYKDQGVTRSRLYSTYGNYPNEVIESTFDWSKIAMILVDSILLEKDPPRYSAQVIDGDTIWSDVSLLDITGRKIWVFDYTLPTDSAQWEYYWDVLIYPNVQRIQVSDYILRKTYNYPEKYGKRKLKKAPIVSRKNQWN